jgi:transcriptional regulator with XRE-family HTH domain
MVDYRLLRMFVRMTMPDDAPITGEQCRAARAWLEWSQEDLADLSKVGLSTIKDLEKGKRKTMPVILEHIRRIFEEVGVSFQKDQFGNGTGISVQPNMHHKLIEMRQKITRIRAGMPE